MDPIRIFSFRALLFTLMVALAASTFISNSAFESRGSTGRNLLQTRKGLFGLLRNTTNYIHAVAVYLLPVTLTLPTNGLQASFKVLLNRDQLAIPLMEMAHAELYGQGKHSYDMLRWYESKVNKSNPGSLITIDKGDDDRFIRMFVCYRSCYDGFIDGCQPLLFLVGTFIKNRSKGTLLAAFGCDANNDL